MERLSNLNAQFRPNIISSEQTILLDGISYPEVIDYHPKMGTKLAYRKKQGWGYEDSQFELIGENLDLVRFTGDRYLYSGLTFPHAYKYVKNSVGVDDTYRKPA